MNDEAPLDLQTLEPPDPPDLVGPAIRRFRWKVVLFTVGTVVVVSVLAVWVAVALTRDDPTYYVETRTTPEQAAIQAGAGICETPSFVLGGTEVALIEAAPMPDGATALHFVVHGDKPLTDQRDQPDGSSFAVFTNITAQVDGASAGGVEAQPGAMWGEAFMQLPASAGDNVEMTIKGPDKTAKTFTLDLGSVDCKF